MPRRKAPLVVGRDLDAELAELEKKNPKVRKAAMTLDDVRERQSFRQRINARRAAEGKPPLRGS